MFKNLFIFVIALACLISAGHAEANEPGADERFPRIGAMLIAVNSGFTDPAMQEDIARLDLAVLQFLPTFNEWSDTSIAEVLGRIKSRNPDITLLQYVIVNEQFLDSDAYPGVGRKIDAERWWLYQSGGSGQIVRGEGRISQGEANYTRFSPRDLNGLSYSEWLADWSYRVFYENVPQWDGIYVDNFWISPRHNGDWNRDGSTDSRGSEIVARWHREGMADFVRAVSAKLPGNKSKSAKSLKY